MQVSILPHGQPARVSVPEGSGSTPLRVVVAPQAFKGTLGPVEAADAMADGVHAAVPDAVVDLRPLADGGDGTVDVLVRSGFARMPATTRGPTGAPVATSFAMRDGLAVVELACTCGLALLPAGRPAPLTSSTAGLGDVIRAALDADADELVICVGGSASTDGGAGMLGALGATLLDSSGAVVTASGATLPQIDVVDLSTLDSRLRGMRVTVATDVANPLLGPEGAAAVFAPQKGATPEEVDVLERALLHWADALRDATGLDARTVPGAGAAGGTGFAAISALHADVEPGAAYVQHAVDVAGVLAGASLLLTGEGRLDAQSLMGKGTGAIAALARSAGVPVLAVCGRVDLDAESCASAGFTAVASLVDHADGRDPSVDARAVLVDTTASAVRRWGGGRA